MTLNNITLQEIMKAHKRIKPYIYHTPLEFNRNLSHTHNAFIYMKLENLQVTGSFKSRGSLNKLLTLTNEKRKKGVIAPTAGNHGIGLAYASYKLNVPAYVYLPENTDPSKIETLKNYGAVIQYFKSIEEARLTAIQDANSKGLTFLSAYNDPSVIAAGGTVALEIMEDLPDVDVVITCLGGGGLTSGILLALKSINPNIQVWGVQTENSPTIAIWYQNKVVTPVDIKESVAEGLSGIIEPETITFPIIQKYIDRILTVKEDELIHAMRIMLDHHYIIEPSGGAGLAALNQCGQELKEKKVAVIVTGRNISWLRFLAMVEGSQ